MAISEFLFDLPKLLVAVLEYFVDFMSSPVPEEIIILFDTFVFIFDELATFIEKLFPLDFTWMYSYFSEVYSLLNDAPFAFWILIFFLIVGFVFAIVFFVLDVLDRINFLT